MPMKFRNADRNGSEQNTNNNQGDGTSKFSGLCIVFLALLVISVVGGMFLTIIYLLHTNNELAKPVPTPESNPPLSWEPPPVPSDSSFNTIVVCLTTVVFLVISLSATALMWKKIDANGQSDQQRIDVSRRETKYKALGQTITDLLDVTLHNVVNPNPTNQSRKATEMMPSQGPFPNNYY